KRVQETFPNLSEFENMLSYNQEETIAQVKEFLSDSKHQKLEDQIYVLNSVVETAKERVIKHHIQEIRELFFSIIRSTDQELDEEHRDLVDKADEAYKNTKLDD